MSENIELIPTVNLIDELIRRFDHGLFVGLRVKRSDYGETELLRKWNGSFTMLVGMAASAEHLLLHLSENGMRDTSREWI